MTDEQLVAHIREAIARVDERTVEAAAERLFDRHAGRVRAIVLRAMPEAFAEELAQEVFLAATLAIFEGRPIENFRAWINRVAKNKIADFWRSPQGQQLKRDRAAAPDDDDGGASVAGGVSTDAQDLFELEDLIESALSGLRDSHRQVVELSVFEKLPGRDVAAVTGESEANVYQVVKRFRDRLRKLLEDNDYEVGT